MRRIRVFAVCGIVGQLLLACGGGVMGAATDSSTLAYARKLSAAASASPSSVSQGGSTALDVSVTSSIAITLFVDIEIRDAANNTAFKQTYDNQAFAAGQTLSYAPTWAVPTAQATGSYTVDVGLYAPGGTKLYTWKSSLAQITVSAGSAPDAGGGGSSDAGATDAGSGSSSDSGTPDAGGGGGGSNDAGTVSGTPVVADVTTVVRTLSPTFHGINYVGFWDSIQGSSASAAALAATGIKTVRFAGGDPADWYDWQCPYWDGSTCPATPNGSSWSTTSPLQLWQFAQSFGGVPFFQTNYQGNLPNPPGQSYAVNSAQNQAAWASYNLAHGINATFEIGNEEDINMTTANDSNFQPYITAFTAQAQAIHGVGPATKVFGPAGTNEYYWWALNSLGMFLQQTGNRTGSGQVDGVSLHFYKGSTWSDSSDVPQYWASSGGPWEFIQSTIGANDTRNLPVYISEWHVGASDATWNPTMANALVTDDMIGAFAQSGVAGYQYFDIHGAGSGTNAYGILYGSGDARSADSPTPAYYGLVLWGHMGVNVVSLSTTLNPTSGVSAYATTKADGSVQVMLIEKAGTSHALALGFNGYNPAGRTVDIYTVVPTTGRTSLDVRYNGALDPSPTALPAPASQTVPGSQLGYTLAANSIAVLDFH